MWDLIGIFHLEFWRICAQFRLLFPIPGATGIPWISRDFLAYPKTFIVDSGKKKKKSPFYL